MHHLTTIEELDTVFRESSQQAVVVYKHSSTCPVAAAARERMASGIENGVLTAPVYEVVVQEARDVSDEIAERIGVKHESPQVIVLKDGEAVYNESHGAIEPEAVAEQV